MERGHFFQIEMMVIVKIFPKGKQKSFSQLSSELNL